MSVRLCLMMASLVCLLTIWIMCISVTFCPEVVHFLDSKNCQVGRWSKTVLLIRSACRASLRFHGEGLQAGWSIAFTQKLDDCMEENLRPVDSWKWQSQRLAWAEVELPPSDYYLCLRKSRDGVWTGLGGRHRLRVLPVEEIPAAAILGLAVEDQSAAFDSEGIAVLSEDEEYAVRFYGRNLSADTSVALTELPGHPGSRCDEFPMVSVFRLETADGNRGRARLRLRRWSSGLYYLCVKESQERGRVINWIHQGTRPWLGLRVQPRMFHPAVPVLSLPILLFLSGLFSGLNLGLLSLGIPELLVIEKCGDSEERRYARTLLPLRQRGNYLLCSLLLGNCLVNAGYVLILGNLLSASGAVIVSTVTILFMGELIPQAITGRYALAVGAKTILITKLFMLVTFPLSYPIGRTLDCLMKGEIFYIRDRKRLKEFIRIHRHGMELQEDEMDIIMGALELKSKTVDQIMTKIQDVYMISNDAVLDFETFVEVIRTGYTRIPVYHQYRSNVVAILHVKDLIFVDPQDKTPVGTICDRYRHPVLSVGEKETLDVILEEFKRGRSHLALVKSGQDQLTGVVTLEDVIEEIIQSEIVDETDILTDNKQKKKRTDILPKRDFSDFVKIGFSRYGSTVSSQLVFEAYLFLQTSVDPFKNLVSRKVLRNLMYEDIFFRIDMTETDSDPNRRQLFRRGLPADYFVLVCQGRVRSVIGQENLALDAEPFAYFGLPALSVDDPTCRRASWLSAKDTFLPDYTVTAITNLVYVKITRAKFLLAYQATLATKSALDFAPD